MSSTESDALSTLPTIDGGGPSLPEAPVLAGRYRVLGTLGQGGMGVVHRVHDLELDRVVAMKVLGGGAELDLEVAEAMNHAALQHPNIVPVYDTGIQDDGRRWFTMREVAGDTFDVVIDSVHAASTGSWRADANGWTLQRLIVTVVTTCRAMAYAHGRGLLHRDLKPANLMTGPLGEVYVLDWGIATRARTHPDKISGTPAYMSPQQARGEAVDIRDDVYALGAILFTVLTGKPPLRTRHPAEALARVTAGDLDPIEARDGRPLPRELVEVVHRAMSPTRSDRFESALAMAHAIEGWLDEERRRERALEIMRAALADADEAEQCRQQARDAAEESAALLAGIAPWAPEEEKAPGWAKADASAALARKAQDMELQVDHGLHGALRMCPGLPEAHRALADRHLARHETAVAARDSTGMAQAEWWLRTHIEALPSDDATRKRCAAYLVGDGALTLVTDPPNATVELFRYIEKNRRLVLEPYAQRQVTPILEMTLPMGSYLAVIRAPGRAPVRYPIDIPRLGHWDGIRPGNTRPTPIWLPPSGMLGNDEVYVPAGWFESAGDPIAFRSTPARRVWCDAMVFARFPVTNREYLAFLDALVSDGREHEALLHAPRERASSSDVLGALLYGRNPDGSFCLQADGDGDFWDLDWPVFHLDWHGAQAYLVWRAEQTGRPWRLPGELEWEKAARGVDGRWYPWGDFLDPSFCCTSATHRDRALPKPVDTHPIDESPYGIRGMGGNIRDWCGDLDGRVTGDVVMRPTQEDLEGKSERTVRGGSWFDGPRSARSGARDRNVTGFRVPFNGIRGVWRPAASDIEPPSDT